MAKKYAGALCHSSHSRVSKTGILEKLTGASFATVHILASARQVVELNHSDMALPQFTFSRQQDNSIVSKTRAGALPQFTFSRQQDEHRRVQILPQALPQFTFSRQQDPVRA